MMDWIKENKFVSVLGLIVLVVAGGLYYFGGSQATKAEDEFARFEQARNQLQNLERGKPYPTQQNLEARRKELADYRTKVAGLQKQMLAYRPEAFDKIPPAEFTNRLNNAAEKLKGLYRDRGVAFPEDWQLGFETYIGAPPPADATAFLDYQLSALVWLYSQLAASRPAELLNVVRQPLPVEEGKPMDGGGGAPQRGGRGSQGGRQQGAAGGGYYRMPLELTFRGREASLRRFMETLVNSQEHFFTVRSLRVQNEGFETVPEKDEVEFEKKAGDAGGAADPFSGAFDNLVIPEDVSPAPDETAEVPPAGEGDAPAIPAIPPAGEVGGERILGQVLGSEQLNVFLELELLLFKPDVKLPSVNSNP